MAFINPENNALEKPLKDLRNKKSTWKHKPLSYSSFITKKKKLSIQASYHGLCFQVRQFKENAVQSDKTDERLFFIFTQTFLRLCRK